MKYRKLAFVPALPLTLCMLAGAAPASAAWISSYAGNYSGISGYTYVNVVNTGKKDETVTVRFIHEDGAEAGSTQRLLPVGQAWSLTSASGFTNAVATGDFNGYVRIESTGSDKKLAVFSMVAFPVDGSTAIGNPMAVSGVAVNLVRGK
jgi:hypothetical protein